MNCAKDVNNEDVILRIMVKLLDKGIFRHQTQFRIF